MAKPKVIFPGLGRFVVGESIAIREHHLMKNPPIAKNVADSKIDAGSVMSQARPIFLMVSIWMPDSLAHIVPATPDESTWVVLTGKWKTSATPIVKAAITSAEAPCA